MLVAGAKAAHNVLGWTPKHSSLDEMISRAWDFLTKCHNGWRRG